MSGTTDQHKRFDIERFILVMAILVFLGSTYFFIADGHKGRFSQDPPIQGEAEPALPPVIETPPSVEPAKVFAESAPAPTEVRELSAPVPRRSKVHFEIPSEALERVSISMIETGRGVPLKGITPIEWDPVDGAEGYELEVAISKGFHNSHRFDLPRVTQFVPGAVRPGSFFFRIRAKGPQAQLSPPSEMVHMEISIAAPVIEPIEFDADEAVLRWSRRPFASGYEIEWLLDENPLSAKTSRVAHSFHTFAVSRPIHANARVRALAADGTPISPFSEPQRVEVEPQAEDPIIEDFEHKPEVLMVEAEPAVEPEALVMEAEPVAEPTVEPLAEPDIETAEVEVLVQLPEIEVVDPIEEPALPQEPKGPILREPAANTPLVSIGNAETFVRFRWQEIEGAELYQLQLAQDPDFFILLADMEILATHYLFQDSLPEGSVYWRVRAKLPEGFSGWSRVNDLMVQPK